MLKLNMDLGGYKYNFQQKKPPRTPIGRNLGISIWGILSKINVSWKEEENNKRTSKMAKSSVPLDSLKPTSLDKMSKTLPLSSWNTPQILVGHGFSLIELSTFNFKRPAWVGGDQATAYATRGNLQWKEASQLWKMSSSLKLVNSSLMIVHFVSLQFTTKRRSLKSILIALKILCSSISKWTTKLQNK